MGGMIGQSPRRGSGHMWLASGLGHCVRGHTGEFPLTRPVSTCEYDEGEPVFSGRVWPSSSLSLSVPCSPHTWQALPLCLGHFLHPGWEAADSGT